MRKEKLFGIALSLCLVLTGCGAQEGTATGAASSAQMEEDPVNLNPITPENLAGEDAPQMDVDQEPGQWDLNHDGTAETVRLLWNCETEKTSTLWALQVIDENGNELWSDSAASSHAGWNALFLCTVDGQDCLLRYRPTVYQGWATYGYRLFYLDENGEETVLKENSVDFDLNFGMDGHTFDIPAIATFLNDVYGYINGATVLLSTEGDGEFRSMMDGAQWSEDTATVLFGNEWFGCDIPALEKALALEEKSCREERGIA